MSGGVTVQSDGVLEAFDKAVAALPQWMPTVVRRHLGALARPAADRMREAMEANRYTGSLERSISDSLSGTGLNQQLEVYPTVKRGRWDGGLLLEMGTGPRGRSFRDAIFSGTAPPWGVIKQWADFRGLPAFPVWYGIITKGTRAHPFLQRTKDALQPQIDEAGRRMVEEAARRVAAQSGLEV